MRQNEHKPAIPPLIGIAVAVSNLLEANDKDGLCLYLTAFSENTCRCLRALLTYGRRIASGHHPKDVREEVVTEWYELGPTERPALEHDLLLTDLMQPGAVGALKKFTSMVGNRKLEHTLQLTYADLLRYERPIRLP